MININEKIFFEAIKEDCDVIFDIGCRDDVYYIEASEGKTFHLFEPNPDFYEICNEKIKFDTANTIFMNNFGIGRKSQTAYYWSDSQSFFKRYYNFESKSTPILLPIKKFSEYLDENNIGKIDFLKIDAEGCDPDVFLDNPVFIKNNVQYIQFEFASTWIDRGDGIGLKTIFDMFKENFSFQFLFNEEHPVSKQAPYLLTAIGGYDMVEVVETWALNSYGFEIIMIKK